MIKGLTHLVHVPVSPYLPKPPDLRFPHGGVINPKGVRHPPPPPIVSVSFSFAVIPVFLVDPIFFISHHYVPPQIDHHLLLRRIFLDTYLGPTGSDILITPPLSWP